MVHRAGAPRRGTGPVTVRDGRSRQRLRRPLRRLVAIGLLLGAAAAGAAADQPLRQRVEALRTAGDARVGAGSEAARALIAQQYERGGFAPLWADAARERALLAAVEASATHGLDPRDYHAGTLAAAHEHAAGAERDLLLTDAFVRLAYHLHFGKADPRSLQHGWNFDRTLAGGDPAATLARLLAEPDPAAALARLAPRLPEYDNLRRALAQLREVERRGGWPRVDAGGKLEAGSSGPRVRQLRARLRADGDLDGDDGGEHFDAQVEGAVRRFQSRHGLEADGVVGRATLAALNATVAARIDQVRANLERLRWVARELAGDYLLVDIAGFSARLRLDGAPAWTARAIVGRPFRTTPEFRATMKYLVLNPEWNVPPTILREDVLPKVARSPEYLRAHEMRVLDAGGRAIDPATVDWPRYRAEPRAFPFQVVQAPGRDNPLGRIKLMFPNEHSVYLHDTPARALFDRPVRAFSSGCIRIDKPLALAALLLDDAQRWGEVQLAEAIATGATQTLPVRRAVPVLLLYFTAVADDDGRAQFRPDLYGRDAPIVAALAAPFRFAPVDRAPRRR